jgi:hypothetical protein
MRVNNSKSQTVEDNQDESILQSFGLKKNFLLSWIYPILTFVIGDVITTYYGVTHFGLEEKNIFVLIGGYHTNPISFLKIKMIIILFTIFLSSFMYFASKFARLNDIKNYLYYMYPFLVGTMGLVVVINNINEILKAI